jgi:hypothetical protein
VAVCGCLVVLPAGDVGLLQRLLLGVCGRCARLLYPRWQGWHCVALVVVSWRVVFSHRVSGCVWVPGCVARGSEGPGEQVGGEGGTAGVPGGSPPPGASPGVFWGLPWCVPAPLSSSGTPYIPCLRGGGWWWWVCHWGVVWLVGGLFNHGKLVGMK